MKPIDGDELEKEMTRKAAFGPDSKIPTWAKAFNTAHDMPDVTAKVLCLFFKNDPPCSVMYVDDKAEAWCAEHCGQCHAIQCWEKAVEERWNEKYEINRF